MKKEIFNIQSITQVHEYMGLEKPRHPLVSIYENSCINAEQVPAEQRFTSELYVISLKGGIAGSFNYGRNSYDFQDGTMVFMSPNQVFSPHQAEVVDDPSGWTLLFHPDLIRKSELGRNISQYSFFSYEANEALHVSDEEKQTLTVLAEKIKKEYQQNIDKHTQDLIIINLESLLKYCQRYYDRQFYTRTNLNKDYITTFNQFLKSYFESDLLVKKGIPTVKQCGEALHMSGHYLSDLLKSETGKSAKEHIHLYLVDKAKTILLNTNQSISAIAYDLGFEYPQHFSKLFKTKTGLSPSEYRTQLN